MGFKRKRESYREFRPRLSPAELLVARVRPAIAQIGEPSRYAREGLMRSLVHDLGEVPEEKFSEVLQTIRAVVYEQPHKIGYLSYVITAAPPTVSFLVLEMTHEEAARALQDGNLVRFKLFFRFLCALHPVVANPEVLTGFISALLNTQPEDPRIKTELYKTALLASLYLPQDLVSEDLRVAFASTELQSTENGEFDFFVGDSKPYPTKHLAPLLMEAAQHLKSHNWDAQILAANPLQPVPEGLPPKPAGGDNGSNNNDEDEDENAYEPRDVYSENEMETKEETAETTVEKDAEMKESAAEPETAEEPVQKHHLRELHLTDSIRNTSPLSPAFFQCFLPLEGGIDTVPPPNTASGLLLRDVATDMMRHMDFNRREVTRQLIALDVFFSRRAFAPPGAWLDQIVAGAAEQPPKPTYKVEDIALEAVFSQMFDLQNTSGHPAVYYHALLIEACVMAPQDIAPVLGRGIRFMFSHLDSVDAELVFRLVDWFSHHVSNFAFTWKWQEWMDALELPADHPKLVFIKELLAKEVRLSYPQRVRDVLPEEFQPFVPNPPDVPAFKYADDSRGEKLAELLKSGDNAAAQALLAENKEDATDLLVHTVCHLGNRSVTHASTWIAKTEDLLREFASQNDDKSAADATAAVFDHWAEAPWIGALVINQFIKAKLVQPQTFINHIVDNSHLLLSSLGWESLTSYVEESRKALENVELQGEYGEWWKTRLQRAISRIAKLNVEKKQAEEQKEEQRLEKQKEEQRVAEAKAEEMKTEEMKTEETKTEEGKSQEETQPEPVQTENVETEQLDQSEQPSHRSDDEDEPNAKRQKTT